MTTPAFSPLQPYLPRLVLDWQETMPDARFREIDGSMVFVDVSGFTKMSERLARQGKVGAEEVSDVIGATFGALLAEAYACGGSLIKFGGDALLIFFQGDGHALRAVAAAHGMRAELRRSGTFSTSSGKVTLRMSVGAHTGRFHFFLVGGSHRELIVAGPAATQTVTMEGAASAGQVLLSPALAAALPVANRGRLLGPGVLLTGTPPPVARTQVDREPSALDLEPFVSLALRETVLAGDVEPEHRAVTIAFIHFGAFDEMLSAGPDGAAAALDHLVRSAQEAAETHGVAFLASDIAPDGGKIILTAGAPVVTGADEERMLLTVREIVTSDATLPLEIGVNKGPVFAGAIGPSYRRTYTVMGDAVNLAARLMAKAAAGEIVATPQVLDSSRTIFETVGLEPFLVKGKKKPITAFTVGPASGSRTTIAESGLPLLGRDTELNALLDVWTSAHGGAGQTVEIVAEPGMGKSRLLDEFLQRAGSAHLIRGECRLYQSATPYFPFQAVLRSAFGLAGLGDEAAIEALTRLVDERAPGSRRWLSLVSTPLGLDIAPSPEVEALDDKFRRERLEQEVAALVRMVAHDPAVVIIEDSHWMDEPSRDLLARMTVALQSSPWLIVLSRRPGTEGFIASDEAGVLTRVELSPLGTEPVVALIHAATEDAPLLPQQERELAERAAGNPLFLIELLDALRRGDDVGSMPDSVEGLIRARIDTLPTTARRRLGAVSVLGKGFRVEHATATLGVEDVNVVRVELRGLGEFLSVDRSGWVEFRHALIRDAAYEGLPFRRRQELHARVGDSILHAAGDHPDEQAELLAVHYWHARRWQEAAQFSRVAGDQAREMYANVEAARFYERAGAAMARVRTVTDDERAAVWRSLGLAREAMGEFDSSITAFRTACALLDEPVARGETHERRALVRIRAGSFRQALADTALGLAFIDGSDAPPARGLRAGLLAVRARIRLNQGRVREAVSLAESAVVEAEAVGALRALAHAYEVLEFGYQQLGQPERAVYGTKTLAIYQSFGDLRGAAIIEMNLGVTAYAKGQWNEAIARYTHSRDELERLGDHANAGFTGANLGEVLVSRGALDEAEIVLARARRVLRASGARFPAVFADLQVARLELARGAPERTVDLSDAAIEEARELGFPDLVLEVSIYRAAAEVELGRAEAAIASLDDAYRGVNEDVAWLETPLGRVRAAALAALRRFEEAEDVLSASLVEARRQQQPYEEALVLLARADLARHRGDAPSAEELREAARLLELLGVSV